MVNALTPKNILDTFYHLSLDKNFPQTYLSKSDFFNLRAVSSQIKQEADKYCKLKSGYQDCLKDELSFKIDQLFRTIKNTDDHILNAIKISEENKSEDLSADQVVNNSSNLQKIYDHSLSLMNKTSLKLMNYFSPPKDYTALKLATKEEIDNLMSDICKISRQILFLEIKNNIKTEFSLDIYNRRVKENTPCILYFKNVENRHKIKTINNKVDFFSPEDLELKESIFEVDPPHLIIGYDSVNQSRFAVKLSRFLSKNGSKTYENSNPKKWDILGNHLV